MPINVLMPALSPTMEKGNLAKWLKKEGDKIAPGDVIAEIETDKATMEVEAVDEGVLAKIVVPEGTADVPVNQLIAVLAGEGEDVKATAAAAGQGAPAAKAAPQQQTQAARAPQQKGGEAGPVKPSGEPGTQTTSASPSPQPSPPRAEGAAPAPTAEGPRPNGHGKLFASPLARRLAKEGNIDLARVQGSGPHGRVIAR